MFQRWRSLSIVVMLLVAPLVGAAPAGSQGEEGNSFRSWNFPDHYIRHRDRLGRVDKIVASDKLGRNDGTFRIVPGLAGQCRSFESVNYPGHFLRHQDYRVKLAPRSDDELFRKDATFCFRMGLASSQARSFESFNYMRHKNFELWIARADSALFKKDATYFIAPALTTHGPAGLID
jgi:hypothetical protein